MPDLNVSLQNATATGSAGGTAITDAEWNSLVADVRANGLGAASLQQIDRFMASEDYTALPAEVQTQIQTLRDQTQKASQAQGETAGGFLKAIDYINPFAWILGGLGIRDTPSRLWHPERYAPKP